jgi:[ribosomal protein S5]-alanine N-acetyltransferase
MNKDFLVILETDRLVLRPLCLTDQADIQRHFPQWDIVKYLSKNAIKWPYPADGAEKFLKNIALPAMERGNDWYWGITRRENPDEVIGVIHLRRDTASGNRGLWIAKEYQNGGYMKEALVAVNDYAFGALGFDKLVIKNAADNEASRQLKLKTGAELLGTKEASHYIGGSAVQEIWELTKENWERFKSMRDFALAAAKKGVEKLRGIFCRPVAYTGPQRCTAAFTSASTQKCAPPQPYAGLRKAVLSPA